jgi:hypothetical protein
MDATSASNTQTYGIIPNTGARAQTWTLEFWMRVNQRPNTSLILWDTVGVATGFELFHSSNGTVTMRTQDFSTGSSVTKTIVTSALTLDTWYHLAAVRDGDDFGFWLDGSSQGTYTNTDFRESSSVRQLLVGTSATAAKLWIDELRWSRIARYDPGTGFTPPASALANDLYTTMLFHYNGTNGDTSTSDDNS